VNPFVPVRLDPCSGGDQRFNDGKVVRLGIVEGRPKSLPQNGPVVHVFLFERDFSFEKHLHCLQVSCMRGVVKTCLSTVDLRTRINSLVQQELSDAGSTAHTSLDERHLHLCFRFTELFRQRDERLIRFHACAFIDESLDQIEPSNRGGLADVHLGSAPDKRYCGRRRVVPKWTVENVRRGQIKLYSLSFHQEIDQLQGDACFRCLLARQQ